MNIPKDLRFELVDGLSNVPFVASGGRAGRKALLSGLPNVFPDREEASGVSTDMMLLVTLSAEVFGPDGEWCLLQLIDNALPPVRGTDLGTALLRLRRRLQEMDKTLRRVPVNPADIAQVHLFDLRPLVYTCIWSLPADARASGFVITTPESKLVSYFCESLKHHGAGEGRWGRNEVVATGPTTVVDSVRATVATVAGKAGKYRPLLAHKHVLWPVFVDNAADAAALWPRIAEEFAKAPEHHLVVAFGMPPGTDAPPGLTPLPPPRFTSQDVSNWIAPIGERLTFQKKEVDWWARLILADCAGTSENLLAGPVYERLEHHYGLITQHRDPQDLMNALKDLELIGW